MARSLDIFRDGQQAVYTISAGRPFLKSLADTLLQKYKHNISDLSELSVFLPTRRAARLLADEFLDLTGNGSQALLLPQIRTLGDIDETDLPLVRISPELEREILPPVSPLERRFVLANLIYAQDRLQAEQGDRPPNWNGSLVAADELGALLDSFHAEQVSFDKLDSLVPEQYAGHWQVTVDFLKVMTSAWPGYLKAQGKSDPADYRRQLLDALCASWNPRKGGIEPAHPVIIAGSTGSMPAVARLMRLVAEMQRGCVILPGLDLGMDDNAWAEIEDPHPQAGLKYLLDQYFDGLDRQEIPEWPGREARGYNRQQLVSLALRPAAATNDWLSQLKAFEASADAEMALNGLRLVDADSPADEARAVAIAMRETLEVQGKTAIFVTPDRELARRVSLMLQRWNIRVDDSAGIPFANTLRGNFLRLVIKWLPDPSNPEAILSLLKHPLCNAGFDRNWLSSVVSELDLVLRGLRPGSGFGGLRQRCLNGANWDALPEDADTSQQAVSETSERLTILLDRLEAIAKAAPVTRVPAKSLLQAHLQIAEDLAATDKVDSKVLLWQYEDGEAGAALLADIYDKSELLPDMDIEAYTDIFHGLIMGAPVRSAGGTHPRLQILGPLEARLQYADLMILGGLNEGTWPDEAKTDSFLSRPMRRALGLPSPERRIGLAAMDFSQGACAPEVLITRSKKQGRAPAKPSRWLVRLRNILESTKLLDRIDCTQQYKHWGESLDKAGKILPIGPPAPCPSVTARPTRFSVTAVEKLLRDPYSIFARYLLGLRRLDAFDADPDSATRGRFYHHIFARFALEYPDRMPNDPETTLKGYADELFRRANLEPHVRAFWQANMQDSFKWFCEFHAGTLDRGQPALIEKAGSWVFCEGEQEYELTARVDRIDQYKNGIFIYDYKTGKIPTEKQGKLFSPQLQLTGLIAKKGGFAALAGGEVAGYGYLKAVNRTGADRLVEGEEALDNIRDAENSLRGLVRHYQNPAEPYLSQPRPFYQNEYGDYDQLARRGEWDAARGKD